MAPAPLFPRPIAHRGLHDRAAGVIENSRTAFSQAIERSYAIECDLQLSRDGVPMVFHDDSLERLTGRTGRVAERDSAELAATLLTGSSAGDCPQRFTELLDQVDGRVLLQVELKRQPSAAFTDTLAREATIAAGGYAGQLVFESFDPALLSRLRHHGFRGRLGIITYGYDRPQWDGTLTATHRFILRHLLHFPKSRFDFLSVEQSYLGLPAVRLFRALGMPVASWTIHSHAEAQAARAKGADQIVFEGFDASAA